MFCGKIEYLQRWKIFIGTMCLNTDYIGVLTDLNEFLSDTIPIHLPYLFYMHF